MPTIEFKNVSYSYVSKDKTKTKALDDINLVLDKDSINIIVGESGSGKTTLLKTICSLLEPEGNIYFDGVDIDKILIKDRKISYITQENELWDRKNVFDNMAIPLIFRKEKPLEIRRKVYEISEEFDLMHLLVRKTRELSKGQQKKVAFAKAVLKDSDIYLFDEPFAGVDRQTTLQLLDIFKSKMQSMKRTVVFVTHNIKDALSLGDKIVVMKDGKVIDQGNADQIFRSNVNETRELIRAEGFNER